MATKRAPRTLRRPDGTDMSRYRRYETWQPRHWAWEFLRRNPRFQKACKRVAEADEAAKQLVATEFGLHRFKHFSEGYSDGEHSRPRFVAATPSLWSVLDDAPNDGRQFRIRLRPGQVLVRFDLAAASPFALALEAQLRRATTRLSAKLRDLRKRLDQQPPVRTPHSTSFIKHLRYLDLTASGKSSTDAMRVLKGGKDIDSKERRQTAAQAQKYLDDYLVIAVMKTVQKGSVRAR